MNKLNYNVTQLLNELQIFKAILNERNKNEEANIVEDEPYSSKNNKKRKNNNKDGSRAHARKQKKAPKGGNKKNSKN